MPEPAASTDSWSAADGRAVSLQIADALAEPCDPAAADTGWLVRLCQICSQGGKRFAQARMSGRDSDRVGLGRSKC